MKGKVFTANDIPKRLKARPESITNAWLQRQTARYKIVATDANAKEGDRDIIAEELHARIINQLPEKARRIVPMILRMSVQDRVALLKAFDSTGELLNPFKMV